MVLDLILAAGNEVQENCGLSDNLNDRQHASINSVEVTMSEPNLSENENPTTELSGLSLGSDENIPFTDITTTNSAATNLSQIEKAVRVISGGVSQSLFLNRRLSLNTVGVIRSLNGNPIHTINSFFASGDFSKELRDENTSVDVEFSNKSQKAPETTNDNIRGESSVDESEVSVAASLASNGDSYATNGNTLQAPSYHSSTSRSSKESSFDTTSMSSGTLDGSSQPPSTLSSASSQSNETLELSVSFPPAQASLDTSFSSYFSGHRIPLGATSIPTALSTFTSSDARSDPRTALRETFSLASREKDGIVTLKSSSVGCNAGHGDTKNASGISIATRASYNSKALSLGGNVPNQDFPTPSIVHSRSQGSSLKIASGSSPESSKELANATSSFLDSSLIVSTPSPILSHNTEDLFLNPTDDPSPAASFPSSLLLSSKRDNSDIHTSKADDDMVDRSSQSSPQRGQMKIANADMDTENYNPGGRHRDTSSAPITTPVPLFSSSVTDSVTSNTSKTPDDSPLPSTLTSSVSIAIDRLIVSPKPRSKLDLNNVPSISPDIPLPLAGDISVRDTPRSSGAVNTNMNLSLSCVTAGGPNANKNLGLGLSGLKVVTRPPSLLSNIGSTPANASSNAGGLSLRPGMSISSESSVQSTGSGVSSGSNISNISNPIMASATTSSLLNAGLTAARPSISTSSSISSNHSTNSAAPYSRFSSMLMSDTDQAPTSPISLRRAGSQKQPLGGTCGSFITAINANTGGGGVNGTGGQPISGVFEGLTSTFLNSPSGFVGSGWGGNGNGNSNNHGSRHIPSSLTSASPTSIAPTTTSASSGLTSLGLIHSTAASLSQNRNFTQQGLRTTGLQGLGNAASSASALISPLKSGVAATPTISTPHGASTSESDSLRQTFFRMNSFPLQSSHSSNKSQAIQTQVQAQAMTQTQAQARDNLIGTSVSTSSLGLGQFFSESMGLESSDTHSSPSNPPQTTKTEVLDIAPLIEGSGSVSVTLREGQNVVMSQAQAQAQAQAMMQTAINQSLTTCQLFLGGTDSQNGNGGIGANGLRTGSVTTTTSYGSSKPGLSSQYSIGLNPSTSSSCGILGFTPSESNMDIMSDPLLHKPTLDRKISSLGPQFTGYGNIHPFSLHQRMKSTDGSFFSDSPLFLQTKMNSIEAQGHGSEFRENGTLVSLSTDISGLTSPTNAQNSTIVLESLRSENGLDFTGYGSEAIQQLQRQQLLFQAHQHPHGQTSSRSEGSFVENSLGGNYGGNANLLNSMNIGHLQALQNLGAFNGATTGGPSQIHDLLSSQDHRIGMNSESDSSLSPPAGGRISTRVQSRALSNSIHNKENDKLASLSQATHSPNSTSASGASLGLNVSFNVINSGGEDDVADSSNTSHQQRLQQLQLQLKHRQHFLAQQRQDASSGAGGAGFGDLSKSLPESTHAYSSTSSITREMNDTFITTGRSDVLSKNTLIAPVTSNANLTSNETQRQQIQSQTSSKDTIPSEVDQENEEAKIRGLSQQNDAMGLEHSDTALQGSLRRRRSVDSSQPTISSSLHRSQEDDKENSVVLRRQTGSEEDSGRELQKKGNRGENQDKIVEEDEEDDTLSYAPAHKVRIIAPKATSTATVVNSKGIADVSLEISQQRIQRVGYGLVDSDVRSNSPQRRQKVKLENDITANHLSTIAETNPLFLHRGVEAHNRPVRDVEKKDEESEEENNDENNEENDEDENENEIDTGVAVETDPDPVGLEKAFVFEYHSLQKAFGHGVCLFLPMKACNLGTFRNKTTSATYRKQVHCSVEGCTMKCSLFCFSCSMKSENLRPVGVCCSSTGRQCATIHLLNRLKAAKRFDHFQNGNTSSHGQTKKRQKHFSSSQSEKEKQESHEQQIGTRKEKREKKKGQKNGVDIGETKREGNDTSRNDEKSHPIRPISSEGQRVVYDNSGYSMINNNILNPHQLHLMTNVDISSASFPLQNPSGYSHAIPGQEANAWSQSRTGSGYSLTPSLSSGVGSISAPTLPSTHHQHLQNQIQNQVHLQTQARQNRLLYQTPLHPQQPMFFVNPHAVGSPPINSPDSNVNFAIEAFSGGAGTNMNANIFNAYQLQHSNTNPSSLVNLASHEQWASSIPSYPSHLQQLSQHMQFTSFQNIHNYQQQFQQQQQQYQQQAQEQVSSVSALSNNKNK